MVVAKKRSTTDDERRAPATSEIATPPTRPTNTARTASARLRRRACAHAMYPTAPPIRRRSCRKIGDCVDRACARLTGASTTGRAPRWRDDGHPVRRSGDRPHLHGRVQRRPPLGPVRLAAAARPGALASGAGRPGLLGRHPVCRHPHGQPAAAAVQLGGPRGDDGRVQRRGAGGEPPDDADDGPAAARPLQAARQPRVHAPQRRDAAAAGSRSWPGTSSTTSSSAASATSSTTSPGGCRRASSPS